MTRAGGIVWILVTLAYVLMFGLGVAFIVTSVEFILLSAIVYLALHAVGIVGALIAGVSVLGARTPHPRTPIVGGAVVLVSVVLAFLSSNTIFYLVVAAGAAFGAFVAWRRSDTDKRPISDPI